jgi:hypothetical protein
VSSSYGSSNGSPNGSPNGSSNDKIADKVLAAHDITPLLEATNTSLTQYPSEWGGKSPLKVIRSYNRADGPGGLEIVFTLSNVGNESVEIGSFGMSTPAGNGGSNGLLTSVANDAHLGGSHGWVEWVRVVEDEQCVLATPLNQVLYSRYTALYALYSILYFRCGRYYTHCTPYCTHSLYSGVDA